MNGSVLLLKFLKEIICTACWTDNFILPTKVIISSARPHSFYLFGHPRQQKMDLSLGQILAYVRKQQELDRDALLLEPDVDERDVPDGMKAG